MSPRQIEVHIEELVLHGFSPVEGRRVSAALERELARLFTEGGVPERLVRDPARDHVDAGSVERAPGDTPSAVGTAVARRVFGGLS